MISIKTIKKITRISIQVCAVTLAVYVSGGHAGIALAKKHSTSKQQQQQQQPVIVCNRQVFSQAFTMTIGSDPRTTTTVSGTASANVIFCTGDQWTAAKSQIIVSEAESQILATYAANHNIGTFSNSWQEGCGNIHSFVATAAPVNGVCGWMNGETLNYQPQNVNSYCTRGNISGNTWSASVLKWSCAGLYGGSTSACNYTFDPNFTPTGIEESMCNGSCGTYNSQCPGGVCVSTSTVSTTTVNQVTQPLQRDCTPGVDCVDNGDSLGDVISSFSVGRSIADHNGLCPILWVAGNEDAADQVVCQMTTDGGKTVSVPKSSPAVGSSTPYEAPVGSHTLSCSRGFKVQEYEFVCKPNPDLIEI